MALQQHRFPSPLRYPGGKGKLANFIKLVMLKNDLVGREYVEPYAGGASVALSLLFEEYADHIHINDLNRSVFAFWNIVLTQTENLCRLISKTKIDPLEWNRQRDVQRADDVSELDLAFSTFYLNRTSRSGIIGGGMIGGKNQDGPWKLDARFNRQDLIGRIEKIGRYRNRITLTGMDTADYLRDNLGSIANPFAYLDPPYYVKGEGLYENFYRHGNHQEIAGLVSNIRTPWIVSYDGVPEIQKMYSRFSSINYGLRYSAKERYLGIERMYFSKDLDLPDVDSPANISFKIVDRARLSA